jgi:hypothetical protein
MGRKKGGQGHKKKAGLSRMSVKFVSESANPFDLHFNKIKKNVLGRKVQKCEVGRPTKSRLDAIVKRKNTLLQEYKNKDRTGKVNDKRIKDSNGGINKRKAKIFEMKMKESTDSTLTHSGREFIDDDNLVNDRPIDSDFDDDNDLNLLKRPDYIESIHFGGGNDSKSLEGKKSKEEFMRDVMEEKMRLMQEQEMNSALTQKLDDEFRDIRSLMCIADPVPRIPKNKGDAAMENLVSSLQKAKNEQQKKETEVTSDRKDVININESKVEKEYDAVYWELMFSSKVNRQNQKGSSVLVSESGATSSSTGPQDRLRRIREDKMALKEKAEQESKERRQKVISRMKEKKIVILPLIEPKLEGLTVKRDPIKKLKKKVKRELKGAQREIRKDSSFIKSIWINEIKERDAIRNKKVKKILADLASDAHEAKKMRSD